MPRSVPLSRLKPMFAWAIAGSRPWASNSLWQKVLAKNPRSSSRRSRPTMNAPWSLVSSKTTPPPFKNTHESAEYRRSPSTRQVPSIRTRRASAEPSGPKDTTDRREEGSDIIAPAPRAMRCAITDTMLERVLLNLDVGLPGAILRVALGASLAVVLHLLLPSAGLAASAGWLAAMLFGLKAVTAGARQGLP